LSIVRRPRAAAALAALVALALAGGCGRAPARPRPAPSTWAPSAGSPSALPALRDTATVKAADALCATENAQEMGTSRLGKLYGARISGYLTVQRLESQARRELRTALAALPVTTVDQPVVARLLADQDGVLRVREVLYDVLGRQPQQSKLAPMTGPHEVVGAYRDLIDAYLAAGRDSLAAGLPSCATPLITVLYGPGSDEASGATVEFRIAAACRTVSYATEGTTGANTATLGSVMQPGNHKPGDRYDGASGPVQPPVRDDEVVVLTSIHYPVMSATCTAPASPAPSG
jgi:hypothetical protein